MSIFKNKFFKQFWNLESVFSDLFVICNLNFGI